MFVRWEAERLGKLACNDGSSDTVIVHPIHDSIPMQEVGTTNFLINPVTARHLYYTCMDY